MHGVIDRLHALLNTPVGERERRQMFAAAAALLIAVAAVLLLTRPGGDSSTSATVGRTTTTALPPAVPATSADRATAAPATPGSPEATAPYQPPAAADRAVRAFLDGYLAYLYGHGDASSIDRASSGLVTRLAANPPRVSPAQAERKPQIVEIRSRQPIAGKLSVLAMIDDGGVSRYPINTLLARRNGQWQVIELPNASR
jgi:hypothetical protein